MDLSKFLSKGQMQPEEPRLSKEDYAALKKAEREELWARVWTPRHRRCSRTTNR